MGNVQTILSIVRKFTPAGQEMALKLLKENRRVLSREFGFVELPSIISGQEKTKLLEEQLLDRSGSIRGIVSNELGKCTKELTAENIQGIHMGYMIASTMGIKGQKILKNINSELFPDFLNKKNLLAEFVRNELGNRKLAQEIYQVDTVDALIPQIERAIKESEKVGMSKVRKIGNSISNYKRSYDLGFKQIMEQERAFDADRQLLLQKIILSPSTNEEIITLENILKTKYNLKYIHLTDKEQAKLIEQALKISDKNGIARPRNIIFSPISPCESDVGIHYKHSNGDHTIILNTGDNRLELLKDAQNQELQAYILKEQMDMRSTDHPLHAILHEIIHGEQIPFELSSQTARKLKSKENILSSGYAKNSAKHGNFEEVRTELKTKQLLEGLSKSEEEYLDIIS